MMKLLAFAVLAAPCAASTYTLDWVAQFSADPKTLSVAEDADVEFTWSGGHDLWLMADETAYDNCDFTDGTKIGESSPITVAAAAGETLYYSCSVGSHCTSGQKVAVTWDADDEATTSPPTPVDDDLYYEGACQSEGMYPNYSASNDGSASSRAVLAWKCKEIRPRRSS